MEIVHIFMKALSLFIIIFFLKKQRKNPDILPNMFKAPCIYYLFSLQALKQQSFFPRMHCLFECLPFVIGLWTNQYEKKDINKSELETVSLITGDGVRSCSREASRVPRNHFPSWQAVERFASSNRTYGISLQ